MHLELAPGEAGPVREAGGRKVATGFAVLAALCSATALGGWFLDVPSLSGLGFAELPIWPWTAFAYLLLATGYVFELRGRARLARWLWTVPFAIAAIGLIEAASGLDTGFDRLLFPDAIAMRPSEAAGRPGVGPSLSLILLALAGGASRKARWLREDVGSALASAALAMGVAALVLLLLDSLQETQLVPFSSLPGALAGVALALSFITWHVDFDWMHLLAARRPIRLPVGSMLPLLLLLPIFPMLLASLISSPAHRLPIAGQIAIVTGNILIVAFVAYLAARRLVRHEAATTELTQALDTAVVVLTDLDGRIIHWSSGCERLYGWTAHEAIGQHKHALLHSRTRDGGGADLSRHLQELIETRHDGREVTVVERVRRIDAAGRKPVLALSISDVSDASSALAALHASEVRLAEAAAVHELGVFEWDARSGAIMWSPGTEQRLGLADGALDSFEKWAALVDREDFEAIDRTIAQAVAERAPQFRYRYRFRESNGDVRAVEGTSRVHYDSDGAILRTVGVISDVTEREEREAALRRREAQLRSVMEAVPDAIVAIDEDGMVLEFSGAAETVFGYPAKAVLGRRLDMLTPEGERVKYWDRILLALKERDKRLLGRLMRGIGLAADGREFPLEYRVSLANTADMTLYSVFFRDISERVAAEQRLIALNDELAHFSRQSAMSELAADLAHELNQPLSAISNFIATSRLLIARGGDAAQTDDVLRMAGEQSLRAGEIIRRLRNFTARGEVEMQLEATEPVLRDAVALVFMGASQGDARLTFSLDPEAQTIYADRVQVQQVMANLLRNAMEAMRDVPADEREIIIATRKTKGNMVEISVSDNGRGIPEEILDRIFSRFTSTKGTGSGMGIGLSISKRIVEAHGGELIAENRKNRGTTFRFTLPVARQETEV